MWQYVGGPLEVDEHYKVFKRFDDGRDLKTPNPPTRFVPYEQGTIDEEAKDAGFYQEAPQFVPSKVVVDADDPSKLDFQFDKKELAGLLEDDSLKQMAQNVLVADVGEWATRPCGPECPAEKIASDAIAAAYQLPPEVRPVPRAPA